MSLKVKSAPKYIKKEHQNMKEKAGWVSIHRR